MAEMPPIDDIKSRMAIEFELYFSELTIIAAEATGLSASDFLDNVEENRSIPMSANDFKEMSRETFLHGFSSGVQFMAEEA